MRLFYCLFIGMILIRLTDEKILPNCRFLRTFYQKHSTIFQLDSNQTSLTIRPLYALVNQSFSTLSIGIIYRLADTYLVPIPLLLHCPLSKRIYAPIDCELTIIDTRSDSSVRITESTRTTTVPLHFQEYSSIPIRGAYFKQSTIALRNCRLDLKEDLLTSEVFHLRIEFEQTINSPCETICTHPELYQCSSLSNTCQCHSGETKIDNYQHHLCVDTELTSNCSLTPERCRRLCRLSDSIDHDCQCPLGTQRIFSNNIYHCNLPRLSECNDDQSSTACLNGYICREKQCVKLSISLQMNRLPFLLSVLLLSALLIIIILIIVLLKMRSIRCIKYVLSTPSSPTTIREKYTKIHFFE